jgi:hypothetical protein
LRPLTKLAGFSAILLLVFAGAAFVGSRTDIEPPAPASADADHMAPQPVRGLSMSADGLTLDVAHDTALPGRRFELAARIVDARGRTVRDLDLTHTKRMHLIVVRRDATGFQHLHPTQAPDGTWRASVTLPEAGAYRVFADFSARDKAYTLATDLAVDGAVRSRALPAPAATVAVDGLRVSLPRGTATAGAESRLPFTVTRDGRPVAVDDYLGAKGHLVVLREGDLAFLHVHPDEDRLAFAATLPTAGRYRLFLQFRTADGRLHTAAFTREATR